MSEIAEKNTRKLTPADRRQLQRDLATADRTRSQLARHYGVTPAYITQFAKQYQRDIEAIRASLDNQFAGLWIASKEQRIAAYEREYELAAADGRAAHHEWIKTRAMLLRNVAEELGELPNRSTAAIIVPVVHVVEGVDLDALKLKTVLKTRENTPVPLRTGVFACRGQLQRSSRASRSPSASSVAGESAVMACSWLAMMRSRSAMSDWARPVAAAYT